MNVATKFRSKLFSTKLIFLLTASIVMGGFFIFGGTALADTVITGRVTSVDGQNIEVFDATSGITYTVDSSAAIITKNGVNAEYYNISDWDNLTIQGIVYNTHILAWVINDRGSTPFSIPVIFASTISQNTTWHDGQIIIINNSDGLTVQAGVKLTIEAGAIVKLANFNDINVYGNLEVEGSSDKPVFITSFEDDSLGGDCNGDGTSTLPNTGSWGKIKTLGSSAEINIDYAQIKYGGGVYFAPCFAGSPSDTVSIGNTITITHSNLLDNEQLFELGSTDLLKINYSNFWNPDFCYQEYDADGNPIDKWDCGSTIENRGDTVFDLSNNYWGSPLGPTQILTDDDWNKPILGTHILGQANYVPFLTSPWIYVPPKPKLNPVILIPGFFGSGGSYDHLALDPILHTYDDLWAALKLAGYQENKSLFAFPYNWRQSNATSSLLLKQKINEVKVACNSASLADYDCSKVDLVAHSMGGLVARAYIEGDNYQNDVDQLIFLATPQQGSPTAYLAWEGGEAGTGFSNTVLWNLMFSEADNKDYFTNFSYFRGLPVQSLKELLPTYNYLRDKSSGNLRSYPTNYPKNDFLDGLNNPLNLAKLNNIKILNVLADDNQNDTVNIFRVVPHNSSIGMWEYGYPENYYNPLTDQGLEYGAGDNTVPEISNGHFNNFDQDVFYGSNHMKIVSDAQGAVIKELTGTSPNQEVKKNFIQKIFMARIFSPADFLITAPDGKRVGKNFAAGQDINEIDGAYYSGKFATIPNPLDGEYKVELQGTGNGKYQLSISGIDDATSTDKNFTGQITTGAIQDFKINYSSSSPELVGSLQPQDIIPPSLIINSPLVGSSFKHGDKMTINYAASDDFSGVSSTIIKIDNKLISSTTVNLFDYQIGVHTLSVVVFDKAGNSTEKKINFSITADIRSTISDIKETYKRGWLKNSSQRDLLIGDLNILDVALKLLDDAKNVIIKKIEDTKNNTKLSAKEKDKAIANFNKELAVLNASRQGAINLDLTIFEKTLNAAKKSNYLNQAGYDIIKSDLEYLKNNL
jgi:triacylglycerol esterase/lipase EstA (alpha/beta hydrolase family)